MLPFSAYVRANKLHNSFKTIVSFLRDYEGVLAPNTSKQNLKRSDAFERKSWGDVSLDCYKTSLYSDRSSYKTLTTSLSSESSS